MDKLKKTIAVILAIMSVFIFSVGAVAEEVTAEPAIEDVNVLETFGIHIDEEETIGIDLAEVYHLLPVGSIVTVSNVEDTLLMITGYGQVSYATNKLWDYCAVPLPGGMVGTDSNFLFDHSMIASVYTVGYYNEEVQEYMDYVVASIAELRTTIYGTNE